MNYIKLFFSIGILSSSISYCFALNISNSPIQNVTLYPNAANIERIISVQAGESVVTLTGLAANFDINQLQYKSHNIEVYAVSHTDSALDKPSGSESQKLRNEIEQIQNAISAKNSIIQAAKLQNTFLGNVKEGTAKNIRNDAYDAFVTIDQATIEKAKLEQKLKELQNDLAAINDHHFNQRTLKFYVNAAKNGEIELSYVVPYARWQPSYKIELDTQTQKLKVTRMAMIAQKTGEDWKNIKLKLSSNLPQQYATQIQPKNWWVNYYEVTNTARPSSSSHRKSILAEPAAVMAYERETEAPAEPNFPQFEISEQSFSTEFVADSKTSVPSSQQQIYLPMTVETYPAKVSIWAIPRQSTQAMITAEVDQFQNSWPSGIVKLYRDGDYVGEHTWKNSNIDKFLNFGVDPQVQIKVTDLAKTKNTNLGNNATSIQKQKYSIQNLHRFPIQLVVFDSSPQSQNNQLKTSTSYSIQPTLTEWNNQKDINQWLLDLSSKQTFDLDVEHKFTYPKAGRTSGF